MGKYVGVVHHGMAMFFRPTPGKLIEDTVCAAVMFTTDKRIVQRGTPYRKGEIPEKQLKARADKMADKWNAYKQRTGKRFELVNDEKRAKKEAVRKTERDKKRKQAEAAPALIVALHSIVHAVRFNDSKALSCAMERADELLIELK